MSDITNNDKSADVIPLYRTITLRLPPDLYQKLNEQSEAFGLSRTEVCRRVLATKMLDGIVTYQMKLDEANEKALKKSQTAVKREQRQLSETQTAIADRIVEKLRASRFTRWINEGQKQYGKPLRSIVTEGQK